MAGEAFVKPKSTGLAAGLHKGFIATRLCGCGEPTPLLHSHARYTCGRRECLEHVRREAGKKARALQLAAKEADASLKQMKADFKTAQTDRADAKAAVAKATALREKAAAEYAKESSELRTNMAAMQKATAAKRGVTATVMPLPNANPAPARLAAAAAASSAITPMQRFFERRPPVAPLVPLTQGLCNPATAQRQKAGCVRSLVEQVRQGHKHNGHKQQNDAIHQAACRLKQLQPLNVQEQLEHTLIEAEKELKEAVASDDFGRILDCITRARAAGVAQSLIDAAEVHLSTLQNDIMTTDAALVKAMQEEDVEQLETWLLKANAMRLPDSRLVEAAAASLEKLRRRCMYDAFTGDLEKANAAESEVQKPFEELMATKAQEKKTLETTLQQQETDQAAKTKKLKESQVLKDDTQDRSDADEAFFADTMDIGSADMWREKASSSFQATAKGGQAAGETSLNAEATEPLAPWGNVIQVCVDDPDIGSFPDDAAHLAENDTLLAAQRTISRLQGQLMIRDYTICDLKRKRQDAEEAAVETITKLMKEKKELEEELTVEKKRRLQ